MLSMLDELLDGANPAFALTVRMKRCRRIFIGTVILFLVVAVAILVASVAPASDLPFFRPLTPGFFEIYFLTAITGSLVFLGSDFGAVFIEATFQDELLRLTPLTLLAIVHGGMLSSLFFSLPLLGLALAFLPIVYLLSLPVERVFWGTLLLFTTGQTLNAVLLSSYISAKSWRQIGFGAVSMFLFLLSFVGFCFTRLGSLLADTEKWPLPMVFLFGVVAVLFGTAYVLARSHATAKRSFRKTICVNLGVYGVLWTVVCLLAVHLV